MDHIHLERVSFYANCKKENAKEMAKKSHRRKPEIGEAADVGQYAPTGFKGGKVVSEDALDGCQSEVTENAQSSFFPGARRAISRSLIGWLLQSEGLCQSRGLSSIYFPPASSLNQLAPLFTSSCRPKRGNTEGFLVRGRGLLGDAGVDSASRIIHDIAKRYECMSTLSRSPRKALKKQLRAEARTRNDQLLYDA